MAASKYDRHGRERTRNLEQSSATSIAIGLPRRVKQAEGKWRGQPPNLAICYPTQQNAGMEAGKDLYRRNSSRYTAERIMSALNRVTSVVNKCFTHEFSNNWRKKVVVDSRRR